MKSFREGFYFRNAACVGKGRRRKNFGNRIVSHSFGVKLRIVCEPSSASNLLPYREFGTLIGRQFSLFWFVDREKNLVGFAMRLQGVSSLEYPVYGVTELMGIRFLYL